MSAGQHLSLCLGCRQLCEKEPRVACCTTSSGEGVTFCAPSLGADQGHLRLLQSYSSSPSGREVPCTKGDSIPRGNCHFGMGNYCALIQAWVPVLPFCLKNPILLSHQTLTLALFFRGFPLCLDLTGSRSVYTSCFYPHFFFLFLCSTNPKSPGPLGCYRELLGTFHQAVAAYVASTGAQCQQGLAPLSITSGWPVALGSISSECLKSSFPHLVFHWCLLTKVPITT